MVISYKCPILPDKATQQKLADALDACRWLYNKLLERMNEAKENGIKLRTYETQNMIPSLKLENPKLNLVYSKALQMVNYTLHRNIHDASWSKFIFMLSYKAQSAGRKLIKVDPKNTTQRCSACGSIVKKELSDRVHECPYCGFSCDRDYNASRNILIAGMEQPVVPIEPKPLHQVSLMQVLAMTWEALPFRVG
jgi:IS605 OrfB family transposase